MAVNRFKTEHLQKKKRRNFMLRAIIFVGAFFICLAGIFYLIVFSPYFRIKNITVSGTKELSAQEIQGRTRQFLGKKMFFGKVPVDNPLLAPKKEIEQALLDENPRIKTIGLGVLASEKSFFINIEERQPAVIWCKVSVQPNDAVNASSTMLELFRSTDKVLSETEKCFFADSGGFIFADAPILSGGALPTVYDQASRELKIKDSVSSADMLKFILETKTALNEADINLTDFVVQSQTLGDLEILTPDGWQVYLDTGNSPKLQAYALKRVLEEEIKEKRTQLDYIDLRVENRAYYKLKTP